MTDYNALSDRERITFLFKYYCNVQAKYVNNIRIVYDRFCKDPVVICCYTMKFHVKDMLIKIIYSLLVQTQVISHLSYSTKTVRI